jgi:hypothetical protein
LFDRPVPFEQAFATIRQLNGEMLLPTNQEELIKALNTNVTSLRQKCFNNFWLPIVRSEIIETLWLNRINQTEPVPYLFWMTGQPNGYPVQNCITSERVGFSDTDCNEKRCFIGNFKQSPVFHLNGKCRLDPDIDILYVFKFESIMESIYRFRAL